MNSHDWIEEYYANEQDPWEQAYQSDAEWQAFQMELRMEADETMILLDMGVYGI